MPVDSTTLITNSAKYAHYAPGLVNRRVRFNTLAACVQAATTGEATPPPSWLATTTECKHQQRGFSTSAGELSASLARGSVDSRLGINANATRATGNRFGRAMQRYGAVQLAPMRSLLRLGLKAMR